MNILNKIKSIAPSANKGVSSQLTVGIDITTTAVRLLAISGLKEKPVISDFFSMAIKDNDAAQALRQAVSKVPVSGKRVVTSLSGKGVLVRYINLPKMTKEELKSAIQYEAEKHIPFPVSEVNLDAVILNDNLPGGKMLVLLAAVKKNLIESRVKLMQQAGIDLAVIDVNTAALINAFEFAGADPELKEKTKNSSTALLEIDSDFSSFTVIDAHIPRLSRDIAIGSSAFSDANIESVFVNIANEIRRSCDFYESQSERAVETVFLSGEGSKDRQLDVFLSQNLSLPVKFWDPSIKMAISENVKKEDLAGQMHALAVLFGLALR